MSDILDISTSGISHNNCYAKLAQYPYNENAIIHSTSTDGVSVDPISTKNRRIVSNQK